MTDERFNRITAIVLAAGEGKRIGGAKALFSLEGSTFLERITASLKTAGLYRILAVVSSQIEQKVRKSISGVEIAVNANSNADMWSSLQVALRQIEIAEGCLIIPVDHPFVQASTYRHLSEVFLQHGSDIVIPSYNERNGHPVVVPFKWASKLPELSISGGLRVAIRQSGLQVLRVEIEDPGILKNINEISDLESM